MIYIQLFIAFFQVGLFSFGGGYAALPLIQEQTVEIHNWLTMQEYIDLVAISNMTPGPIAINASTFTGMKLGGILGAVCATAGCVAPSCIIVALLAILYYKYRNLDVSKGILFGLKPASAGLIASAGLSIAIGALFINSSAPTFSTFDIKSCIFFVICVTALRFKVDQIVVMSVSGISWLLMGLIFP